MMFLAAFLIGLFFLALFAQPEATIILSALGMIILSHLAMVVLPIAALIWLTVQLVP